MKTFIVEWYEFGPCSNSNPEYNARNPPFVNDRSRYSGEISIKAASSQEAALAFLRPFEGYVKGRFGTPKIASVRERIY